MKLGFIEDNEKYYSLEKLNRILNVIVNSKDFNYARTHLFSALYKLINDIISKDFSVNSGNYQQIIIKYFKIPFKSKRDRMIYIEKLRKDIFNDEFKIKDNIIELVNEFSKNQYKLFAQILNKLDINIPKNKLDCKIFG